MQQLRSALKEFSNIRNKGPHLVTCESRWRRRQVEKQHARHQRNVCKDDIIRLAGWPGVRETGTAGVRDYWTVVVSGVRFQLRFNRLEVEYIGWRATDTFIDCVEI